MRFRSTGAWDTLVGAMEPREELSTSNFHQRMLGDRLRDPEFRAEFERIRAEMIEQLAPAAEGPVVHPGRKRRGRLVFGDASE